MSGTLSTTVIHVVQLTFNVKYRTNSLVYWGLTPQQKPVSYQGGEMMMMKSVFWWRKLSD